MDGQVISHADRERVNRAIEKEKTIAGEYSPVQLDSRGLPILVTPEEFRKVLYNQKATKQELRLLLRALGHERGLFTDQSAEHIECYNTLFPLA